MAAFEAIARSLRSFGTAAGLLAGLALAVLAWPLGAPSTAEAAVGVVPHRAAYDLALGRARSDSTVVRAWGRLEFEWTDVCDGWAVSQLTHLAIANEDGREIESVWSINSWESKDGLRYRFYLRHQVPGGDSELLAGSAKLEGPGRGGQAVYKGVETRNVTLPEGTVFPSMHSLELMSLAEQDRFPVWRVLFDGFADEDLLGVNATLVERMAPDAPSSIRSELLDGQPSWRVRLAFFPMSRRTPEPDREQAFRFFANGIVDELLLDYGDFTIVGSLAELTPLPDPGC